MNKFRYLLLALPLAMMIGYGCSESKNRLSASREADSAAEEVMENEETVEASQMPAQSLALLEAYPDCIKEIKDNFVVMVSGDKLVYDDGKQKDFMGRLDDSDIEDMFYDVYSLPDPKPAFQFDPGRSRSEALFKAMYGSSAEEVRKKLVDVEWIGERVKFMSVNGAADSLRAVARELTGYPELRPYLKSSGTFYWRPVRGAKRMSAHSYGIAFDIGVDKSDYWLWKSGSNDENKPVEYANRIPREIVEIFQKHGFIWGGAWYHYDTMHFEFRPELLKYAACAGR